MKDDMERTLGRIEAGITFLNESHKEVRKDIEEIKDKISCGAGKIRSNAEMAEKALKMAEENSKHKKYEKSQGRVTGPGPLGGGDHAQQQEDFCLVAVRQYVIIHCMMKISNLAVKLPEGTLSIILP